MTTGEYCRAIEAYLCRTNGGHLVRIAGPSFERVCGWEARGVPLRVVYHGIDRAVERQRAKGARRPLPIDFCEGDVLDAFDEWRRAVGVTGVMATMPVSAPADDEGGGATSGGQAEARRTPSLGAHLDRVIARLTARRAGPSDPLDGVIDETVRELDGLRAQARQARGAVREGLVRRLAELDQGLREAAWAQVDEASRAAMLAEADVELAPFRARMNPEAYTRAREATRERLVRDRARLPVLTFDV